MGPLSSGARSLRTRGRAGRHALALVCVFMALRCALERFVVCPNVRLFVLSISLFCARMVGFVCSAMLVRVFPSICPYFSHASSFCSPLSVRTCPMRAPISHSLFVILLDLLIRLQCEVPVSDIHSVFSPRSVPS